MTLYPGIRFEEGRAANAGELPEGHSPSHLVWVTFSGPVRTELSLDGKWKQAVLEPGDCSVIPASAPFGGRWYAPTSAAMIEVSTHSLATICGDDSHTALEVRHCMGDKDPLMAQLAVALRNELLLGTPGGTLYRETLAATLAMHVLRKHAVLQAAPVERRGGLPTRRLRQVVDYMESSLDRPISLDDLAKIAGYAVSHFAHAFKRTTGYAPYKYVLNMRLKRATFLLRESQLGIAEIALQCGFSHQSHLANVFRRVMGTTPGEYRRAFLES